MNVTSVDISNEGSHNDENTLDYKLYSHPIDFAISANIAKIFSVISDTNRVKILLSLLNCDRSVGEIASITDQSESSVSHSLRLLRIQNIVTYRKEKRLTYYKLSDSHIESLLIMALKHQGHS